MMPTATQVAARRLVAPAGALTLAIAGVGWAFPQGLPLWRSVAIISAWAGSGMLVASLLLMVREPRLARWLGGLDSMYRWHHWTGAAAYLLLLFHPLALALAGWTESPVVAWQALSPWAQSWPVNLGWASLLLLMIGLVTTFSLRLSYRRWRGFHYSLGLAVLAGLAHIYVLLGQAGPILLLMALASLALGWRWLGSDLGVAAYPYRVSAVEPRTARMIEATLEPCGARLQLSPGQFVLAAFGDGPQYRGCDEFHPFTLSGIGRDGRLQVSIKALGPCTERIQALEPGVLVRLQGPFGSFMADTDLAPQLWVAGGVGITPFIAVLRQGLLRQPTTLIYLYRQQSDAAFVDELRAMAEAASNFELIAEASGDQLPDLDRWLGQVSGLASRQVQLCGPEAMVEALKLQLHQRGLAASSIHSESFDFR